MNQAMTSAMTSLEQSFPLTRCCVSRAEFHRWLVRANPGAELEYHDGCLAVDRSSASRLGERERRALARLAGAALKAAEAGRVHLVQRRNAPADFTYLAIKARPNAQSAATALPAVTVASTTDTASSVGNPARLRLPRQRVELCL